MILAIGSTNQVKVQALQETVRDYPLFAGAVVQPFSVSSGVGEQPRTFEEIVCGAKNRARHAFLSCGSCSYSFGIESGLFQAPGTNTGYLEACICALYDGTTYRIGLSCGFEVPPAILRHVFIEGQNLSDACYASGITNNPALGSSEGLIGILTRNRIDRKAYTKQSIITALVQLEQQDWYQAPATPL